MKKASLLVSTFVFIVAGCNGHVAAPPPAVTHAYVGPTLFAQTIDMFNVDTTTGLIDPNPTTAYTTTSPSQSFQQVSFNGSNGVQYAYIIDPGGAVDWCTVNSDGTFSNCAATASLPPPGNWSPRAMTFTAFNTPYAYITDGLNDNTYQCAVGMTGNFSGCQVTNNLPTSAPFGIAFATDSNGAQQAYFADAAGFVLLCSMQNDGTFNTCNQTPASGAPNWVPYSITFASFSGIHYAYVADNGTGVPGHVWRCALNADGTFENSSCTQTPANDSALSNWVPYSLTFQTLNGTIYAYVTNSSGSSIGNIYVCAVDSTGLLSNCAITPTTTPNPWQPTGITF
jgi:hypothetical protein